MAQKLVVELFYDIVSPFCWITFETLVRYNKKFAQIELKLKPALLGAIMKEMKHHPPPASKSNYSKVDLVDLSNYFDIPFKRPHNTHEVMFQIGSLKAQRLLTAVAKNFPSKVEDISRTLFLRVWYQHRSVATLDGLKETCLDCGISAINADLLLQGISDSDVKQDLRNTTQEALNYGAFGLPTYVAHFPSGPKLFFGCDRLFLFAHLMNEQFPGPLHKYRSNFKVL